MSSLFDQPKHSPKHLPCPHEKLNTSYLSKRRRGSTAVVTLVTLVVVIAAADTAASTLQLRLGHRCRSLGTDAALRPFFFASIVRALLRLRIVFRVVNCGGGDSMFLNDAAAAAAAAAADAAAFCRLGWSQ